LDRGSIPLYSTKEKIMEEEELSDYEKAQLDEIISDLENHGVFEWVGMDETGDRVLAPNMKKMKELFPDMYDMMMSDMSESLHHLYSLGLVEVEYTEELEPVFRISDEGREYMRTQGFEIGEIE